MTDDQAYRQDMDDQRRVAELALAVLTMRVNTPAGKWVDETFPDQYADLWREAQAVDEEANESMFLSVVNMASLLVEYLTIASPGSEAASWLAALRADYVDTIEGE